MELARTRITIAVMATIVAACSSEALIGSDSDDGGTSLDAGEDGTTRHEGMDAGTMPDANVIVDASTFPCPATLPTADVACDAGGLWCEYGSPNVHSACITRVLCDTQAKNPTNTVWHVFAPPTGSCDPQPSDCPSSYGERADAACATNSVCDYAQGRCACVTCDDYDGSPEQDQWLCRAWSDVPVARVDGGALTDAGACPAARPRLGTPCDDSTVICGYDSCVAISLGPYMWCVDGRWAVGPQTDDCNHPSCQ